MLTEHGLKKVLHIAELSRKDKVLLFLACDSAVPKPVRAVRAIAVKAGLSEIKKWNVSDILRRSREFAFRTPDGWELTESGRRRVLAIAGEAIRTPAANMSTSLRSHLSTIQDADVAAFVLESIRCCEAGYHRAAVVLTWVGAVAPLYDYVVQQRLKEFNVEASRRFSNWKAAKTSDDLARMKEFDFLQVLESTSVIGKNVKQELENRLRLRNACGHPSSLKLSDNTVAAHVEMLILNVFARFS